MVGKRPLAQQRAAISVKESQRLRKALAAAHNRIRQLSEEREAAQRELAQLGRVLAEQAEDLETLAARVEPMLNREDDLRAMLLSAHEQLMRRADEVQTTLTAELHKAAAQQNAPEQKTPDAPAYTLPLNQSFLPREYGDYQELSKHINYQRLVRRIREVVGSALPLQSTVIVVSKGDEDLLQLGGMRRGWHFPQNEQGTYAGYYPADDATAISHLEELRDKGGEFLLFPGTAFWWLERFGEFGQHLDDCYRRVWDDEACIVYRLTEPQPHDAEGS